MKRVRTPDQKARLNETRRIWRRSHTPEQRAKDAAYNRKYRLDHLEEARARDRSRQHRPHVWTPDQKIRRNAWISEYRKDHPYVYSAEQKARRSVLAKARRDANRDHVRDINRQWASDHRESRVARLLRRREFLAGLPPYTRMEPWPTDCQCCYEPVIGPCHVDHEPPIDWAAHHPEYDGPFTLRPTHPACNIRKHNRPDWELRCA